MLTVDYSFLHPSCLKAAPSLTLHSLASDVGRIREREGPSNDDLAVALLLAVWRWGLTVLGVRVIGSTVSRRHLELRNIITSPIWATEPRGESVRATSQYFRLDPLIGVDRKSGAHTRYGNFEGGR